MGKEIKLKTNPVGKEHSVVDMETATKEKSRQRKMRTLKSALKRKNMFSSVS
jgi:hypothetical protein